MLNLLKIEGFKMRRFIPLYASMGVMLFIIIDSALRGLKQSYIDAFPNGTMHDGFIQGVQDASFSFLIGMLIAWYVGADFSNRTLHRAVVTGSKRWKIVISQFISTCIITILVHISQMLASIAMFAKGFGFSFEGFNSRDILWFGVVILQLLAMNAFYILISYICGNVYSALFACVAISTIGGNILRNYLGGYYLYDHSLFCFAKSSASSDLIPCAICAIISIVALLVATVVFFNKRDVSN